MGLSESDFMRRRWYPVMNDLIGGWAVSTVDKPCSAHNHDLGEGEVADFINEETARHIAELHNDWLETLKD